MEVPVVKLWSNYVATVLFSETNVGDLELVLKKLQEIKQNNKIKHMLSFCFPPLHTRSK